MKKNEKERERRKATWGTLMIRLCAVGPWGSVLLAAL